MTGVLKVQTAPGVWSPVISGEAHNSSVWSSPLSAGVTVGNGTTTAYYTQVGKQVTVNLAFVLGTTSAITGNCQVTLPVPGIISRLSFTAVYLDANVGWYQGLVISDSSTVVSLFLVNTSGSFASYAVMSATAPFTWVATDSIVLSGSYVAV